MTEMTPTMHCHKIVAEFNTSTERSYWAAHMAGAKSAPCVRFTSRASMIRLTYWPKTQVFIADFSKTACAFGDYMASLYRSLSQVLNTLKAIGEPVAAPFDDRAELRIAYSAVNKQARISLANTGDDWLSAPDAVFAENQLTGING